MRYMVENICLSNENDLPFCFKMYIHSPDDLPYFNSITYDAFSDPTIYRFNVEEYDNNPDVQEEAIQQRSCKFPNEKDPGSPWHYR